MYACIYVREKMYHNYWYEEDKNFFNDDNISSDSIIFKNGLFDDVRIFIK